MGIAAALALAGCMATAPQAPAKQAEIPVFPPPPERARFVWERAIHSSADVVADDKNAPLRRMVTGEIRTGEGLAKPYAVAARGGRIYVGDTVSRLVVLYDLNRKKQTHIGASEPGALRMPFGMDLDAAGNLYVVDGTLKRVHVYDPDGKFLRVLGKDIPWSRPSGLAVDARRKRLYVVDAGGVSSDDHKVRVLDAETGRQLLEFGKRGEGPGELNLPRDAAVGPDGLVYVVDSGNFRVQVFDPEGRFVRTFGAIGRQTGQFSRPKEIAADREGNIYVADSAFGNFQIFNPRGELLMDVGGRSATDAPARFMLPSGIAVDDDGRVYMVDQFFRKVEVFRPAHLPATHAYGQPPEPVAPAATAQRPTPAPAAR